MFISVKYIQKLEIFQVFEYIFSLKNIQIRQKTHIFILMPIFCRLNPLIIFLFLKKILHLCYQQQIINMENLNDYQELIRGGEVEFSKKFSRIILITISLINIVIIIIYA